MISKTSSGEQIYLGWKFYMLDLKKKKRYIWIKIQFLLSEMTLGNAEVDRHLQVKYMQITQTNPETQASTQHTADGGYILKARCKDSLEIFTFRFHRVKGKG